MKWISVEESYPESDQWCAVIVRYANSDNLHTDQYFGITELEHLPEWRKYATSCITHWLPLPEPPEDT